MDTPERYYRVSETQLSIARHYGGIRFNETYYVYDPTTDTLISEDVVKRERKAARTKQKAEKAQAKQAQEGLPL